MSIHRIEYDHNQYPELLREIASAPKQLYYTGKLRSDVPLIAIVGSRTPSRYGRVMTEQLAGGLARCGIGIVSGLALGIDATAHRAALKANGYTLAVQACGIDRLYPSTNRQLGIKIIKQDGAILSEYPEGTPPLKQHFPARNRIISGLAKAVIVTEASLKSGSLITARFGLEQNRLIMAVPGNATSSLSEGTNNLIKAGAYPVTNIDDVLAALELTHIETSPRVDIEEYTPDEAAIIELVRSGITDNDQLIYELDWEAARFNQIITMMELSGKVRNVSGAWIASESR